MFLTAEDAEKRREGGVFPLQPLRASAPSAVKYFAFPLARD